MQAVGKKKNGGREVWFEKLLPKLASSFFFFCLNKRSPSKIRALISQWNFYSHTEKVVNTGQ